MPDHMQSKVDELSNNVDEQNSPRGQQSSKLLSLPGELRNHIYYMCADDSLTCPTHYPFYEHRPLHERQDAFALTQVCRQLRSEFLPVYMQNRKCWTPLRRLPAFLAAYHPSQLCTDLEGSLCINCEYLSQNTGVEYDLTHLVRLTNSSPHFLAYSTGFTSTTGLASCIDALCGGSNMALKNHPRHQKRVRFIIDDVESLSISTGRFYGTNIWGERGASPKCLLRFKLRPDALVPDIRFGFGAWCIEKGWSWLFSRAGFQFNDGPIAVPTCLENGYML